MALTFGLTLLIGSVSFKLTGVYFAMITLGFAEIAKLLMIEVFGEEAAIIPQAGDYAIGVTVPDLLNNSVQGFGGLYVGIILILFVLYVPGGLLGALRSFFGGTLASEVPRWVRRHTRAVADAVE